MTFLDISKQDMNSTVLKRLMIIGLVSLLSAGMPVSLRAQTATDYIRQKKGNIDEDPLISAFKDTLIAAKAGHWGRVEEMLSHIWPALKHYSEDFGVDLRMPLEAAVAEFHAGKTMKLFAHTIFLGLRDNLRAAADTAARDDSTRSFAYLETARSYYRRILAGNIKRKHPAMHKEISRLFLAAQSALGSSEQSNVAKFAPDPAAFAASVREIEINIQSVYTYFKK